MSERRKVLFFAKNPNNIVAYLRVLRRLLIDSRIELYVTSKNDFTHPATRIFDEFDLDGARRVNHRVASMQRYDLYLSPDMYLLGKRCTTKVHTFHGISIKGKAFSDKVLAYDRLFLIGPYQRRRFVELGVLAEDDARFVNIGMPKTDSLIDGTLDRKEFLASHDLDPARPTVLYAPTWRPECSLYEVGEELVRSMRGGPYNFLVKLHDIVYRTTRPVDWSTMIPKLEGQGVRFIREADSSPALHAANVLISDASSVANEYTLLDRPLVFIDVPRLFAKYEKTVDLDSWGQRSGTVARGVREIHKAIERALSDPDEHREMRSKIAEEGFYNAGHATDAAVGEIGRILELD